MLIAAEATIKGNTRILHAVYSLELLFIDEDRWHPSVTNDNGLASPFGERVFLLQEMRPDKNNMKVKEKKLCHLNNIMN